MIGWHLPSHYKIFPYKPESLTLLFASSVFRRVAISTLAIFSPLYILEVTGSLPTVFAFFLAFYIAKLLAYPLAENLGVRYGFKGVIILSVLPFLVFIPVLAQARSLPILFAPAAILWGVEAGLFWWGYHGFFVKSGKVVSFGQEIGTVSLLETVAMILSPLLGAAVVSLLGFEALFWLSGLILVFSAALLAPASNLKPKHDIKIKAALRAITSHKRMASAYVGNGVESTIYSVFWPVFLFLNLGAPLEVGAVLSAAILLAAVLTFLVGVWTDRTGGAGIVRLGSPILALSWVFRFFGKTPQLFIFSDTLWRFAEGMVALPLNVMSYKKAAEGWVDQALMFRELSLVFGGVLVSALLVVAAIAKINLSLMFLVAAAFSLLPAIAVKLGEEK